MTFIAYTDNKDPDKPAQMRRLIGVFFVPLQNL